MRASIGEPVAAAILAGGRATRAEPIRAQIERGDPRAQSVPEVVLVEEIGPEALATYDPDGLLFVNVNTPHDLRTGPGPERNEDETDAGSYHGRGTRGRLLRNTRKTAAEHAEDAEHAEATEHLFAMIRRE